jgi:hypothetical protein
MTTGRKQPSYAGILTGGHIQYGLPGVSTPTATATKMPAYTGIPEKQDDPVELPVGPVSIPLDTLAAARQKSTITEALKDLGWEWKDADQLFRHKESRDTIAASRIARHTPKTFVDWMLDKDLIEAV